MHIDAAYGGAALCAPSTVNIRKGFERADSFGIDPHKWLFAPYDCAALVYRDPSLAAGAHGSGASTSTLSVTRSGTRATSPSTSRAGGAACRCGSAWPPTARTPTPRRSKRRWRRHARSPPSSSGAMASHCCSIRSCRSPCSRSTAGTTPATRRGARAGRGRARPRPADHLARQALFPGVHGEPPDHTRHARRDPRRHGRVLVDRA